MKKSILIVEDELIIARVYQLILQNCDFTVCGTVTDGISAIKAAEEKKPDLIILDVQLAKNTNGIETAHEIRKFSNVPLIITTGNSISDISKQCNGLKNLTIISKPVDNSNLCEKVKEFLN